MADFLKTSVSVEYKTSDDTDDLRSPVLVLQQDDVQAPYGFAFARLYFAGPSPALFSTSGYEVQTVSRSVVSSELDFLIFQGSDEANFPMPTVSNVRLAPIGRFVSSEGSTLSRLSLLVDAGRGTVKASSPFYGTVQAEYNSIYHRLQVQFRELPAAKDDDRYESNFAPLVLVAKQAGTEASLAFNPPAKSADPDGTDGKKGGYTGDDKSTGEKIVLEIDGMFPISLTHSTQHSAGLTAVARVAVYSPHAGVSYSVSQGNVKTDKYALDSTLEMAETVNFVNAQSASVSYPPVNGVSVSQLGDVTSRATGGSTFHFATAPSMVSIADWFSYGAYMVTGSRMVTSNEIVATSVGVTVPVSGAVKATYSTRRSYISVFWERAGEWFTPVVLTASDAWGNSGSITISPPERRGR